MDQALKNELVVELEKIAGQKLEDTTDLYSCGIDSFSVVEIINLLQEFCARNDLLINMAALTTESELTVNTILRFISK